MCARVTSFVVANESDNVKRADPEIRPRPRVRKDPRSGDFRDLKIARSVAKTRSQLVTESREDRSDGSNRNLCTD